MNKLERHVLELIGENTTSPDVFTDTTSGMEPIRDSINDAIQEITMMTGSYKETYRIPLRTENNYYRLKFNRGQFAWVTDAWLVQNRWRLTQTDLNKLNAEDPRWMVYRGSPEQYFHVGTNLIGISPRTSSSTDVIELNCVVIPESYTSDTDRIKLRDDFQWAAVHYAVSEYYAGRGDKKNAMVHHNKYLQKLGVQESYPESLENTYTFNTEKR